MPGENKKRKASTNVSVNSLEYNTHTDSQKTVLSHQLQEIPTISVLPRDTFDQSPIDFRIDKTDRFLDFQQFYFSTTIKVVGIDESDLTATDSVVPLNNIGYSLWSNVELFMNDQKITEDQVTYPWMSYVHHWTKYSESYKETVLEMTGWCKDEAGLMDNNDINKTDYPVNEGAKTRSSMLSRSIPFTVYGKLFFDFYGLKQYIPNNVSLYVRFIPNAAAAALIVSTETPCKLKIMQANLYIGKVQLSQAAVSHYSNLLRRSGFEFSCRRYQIRTKLLQKGEQNFDWSPYLNCRPRRLYLWQISLSAYNGDIAKNKFNFQMFDLQRLRIYLNDVSLPTNVPMYIDEKLKQIYVNTMTAINNPDAWKTTYNEFQRGYFLLVVDLTKDHSADSFYDSTSDLATLRIIANYKSPLSESIAVFCMIEYDSCLVINNGGECKWKGSNN